MMARARVAFHRAMDRLPEFRRGYTKVSAEQFKLDSLSNLYRMELDDGTGLKMDGVSAEDQKRLNDFINHRIWKRLDSLRVMEQKLTAFKYSSYRDLMFLGYYIHYWEADSVRYREDKELLKSSLIQSGRDLTRLVRRIAPHYAC